jgi:hypothetical protein
MSKARVKAAWPQPVWTKEIKKWTATQVRLNLWRFDPAIDSFDDVMQEAHILFLTLLKKYPIASEAAHFFTIYKTSLARMFIDKARLRQRSAIDQTVNAEAVIEDLQLPGVSNYGYLNTLLDEMPDELKLVLRALTQGRYRLKVDRLTATSQPRENFNIRLKRQFPSMTLEDPAGDLKRVLRYNT